jgi:hypothetical protein
MSRSAPRRATRWLITASSLALAASAVIGLPAVAQAQPSQTGGPNSASCRLGDDGHVRHVIYIQFDNTHLMRDRANVPSDLEQMPHLLSFMQDNGTLLGNDHTILISHTGGGILSSLTGVYPDRHGQTVSNSYVRTSSTGGFSFPSTFGYWTDPVIAANTPTAQNMVGPDGKTAPAPWVPFTRAGCDVGEVATANTVLENARAIFTSGPNSGQADPTGDITKVFGEGSPQFAEAKASQLAPSGTAARALAQTDFVGFAVHCAKSSTTCASGQADVLPEEPNGYNGFNGLFGAQAINPFLTGQPASTALTGLDGNPIVDPFGQPGFPGFDGMSAAVSLAYTAALQEKGVPITYAYISDAHDNHGTAGNIHVAYGPGSAGYVAQLKAYDDAFAAFFTRLTADGINKNNTLFVFTVDEGDHFVGGTPTPAACDGVTTPCDWTTNNQVGEINANIATLVSQQFPTLATQFQGTAAPNAFTVHGDDAPTFYLAKKGAGGGQLGQTDPLTRDFERQIANVTAVDPYTGLTDRLMVAMADQAEMRLLHMYTTGDVSRTPVFAWNHGDIQPDIATTWLGFVGPGVKHLGRTDDIWTDHTDVRPTMLTLLGLHDSYACDGRAIAELIRADAGPKTLNRNRSTLLALGAVYKQLDAPFGLLSKASLRFATTAIVSGSGTDDAEYTAASARIADWTTRRDSLAAKIGAIIAAADSGRHSVNVGQAQALIADAWRLIVEVNDSTV